VKRSKYGNIKTHGFDSKAEYARWLELKLLEKAGKITNLEHHVTYKLEVNGVLVAKIVPDFRYNEVENGELVLEDTKGFVTRDWLLKRRLLWALHGIEVLEIGPSGLRPWKRPVRFSVDQNFQPATAPSVGPASADRDTHIAKPTRRRMARSQRECSSSIAATTRRA